MSYKAYWSVIDIQREFGFGRTSAYALTKSEGFPKPYIFPTKGAGSRKRWRADEILSWAETYKARGATL